MAEVYIYVIYLLNQLVMEKKRVITIYKDQNGPYRQSLLDGLNEGPEKRFVKFFEEKEKFDYFMGIKKVPLKERTIIFRDPTWI